MGNRKKELLTQEFEQLADLHEPDCLDAILQTLERDQLRLRLGLVLRELPARDRNALFCKYFLEYTDERIAVLLGVQTDSVRMILTRARAKVRDHLQYSVAEEEVASDAQR